ncbi:quorum-sensing autoinducer CAI-1 synthase [Prosthecochloris sp. SCSIO W1102]|uniref:alpha-hydroxyketone-type quorum-sensing autoinducer synthase n=1 Tax=Prosthecochloris sp. SCSIO W1102 TaxID=2992243 RepID=UPI00223DB0F7|nr:alpha-hydroxyketone-type quorum-sensing autoinducer synthase [Prosthecochloris sp. SCSIO W1102]UZJ40010.1 quorum-sensing autoinducer CAI-1 synthase [Prosthecochloris sp. SCSIO W1102]
MAREGEGVISAYLDAKFKAAYEKSVKPRKNGKPLVVGNRIPDSNSIVLQSNDYLSLSKHPDITAAQIKVLQDAGREMVMSAVFLHEGSEKSIFEKAMADFVGVEDSVLCQSGWSANVGLLQVIAEENSPVYIDYFSHMSLWQGIKVAGAVPYPFRHNDVSHMERQIKEHGPGIVLVDSLYSTTGDMALLKDIIEVAKYYECVSVVDESHSLGVYGQNGAGLVNELGLTDEVNFMTASLAKAFAGRAGIIFCPEQFAQYYPYMAYPAIFSSTLLPHEIAGLQETLKITIKADEKRRCLHKYAKFLREGLDNLGYNIVSESQIISIESGLDSDTELLRDALEQRDIFGSVFVAPATPKNRSLIRFSLHSELKKEELQYLLRVCEEIRDEVNMWGWKSTKRKGR